MRDTSLGDDSPLRRFRVVAEGVWQHLGLPPLTPVQAECCDWLQYGPKRNQMQGFRGLGKSYLTSAYVCFLLLVNPDEKILVISASKDRADAFVQFTKRLINEIPWLMHLRPNRNRGDRDSNVSFDVGTCVPAHSPSVKAVGITGMLSGSRASCVVMDDVEVPKNSATPAQREKLSEAIKEIDAILLPENKALNIDPKVRVLGTPQSMETVYIQLEERGYVRRVWPIQVPDEDTYEGYRGSLAPSADEVYRSGAEPGTPLEPGRFPLHDIAERRISYGAMGFALQFMLSTALSDAEKYPLKCRDAMFTSFTPDKVREVYIHSNHPANRLKDVDCPGMQGDGYFSPADVVGEWGKPDSTIVAVDPSGRGRDETAIISMSVRSGFIFVHRVFGVLDGYNEATLLAIAEEAKRVKADRLVIESNYGDGMFSQLIRPVLNRTYGCTIEEVKHSTNKERRIIDVLSPVFEGHRIVFHESIPKSDTVPHREDSEMRVRDRQLFYQMTHLTDERGCLSHDDRLDCLAMGVAYFNKFLAIDAEDERRKRAHQALLEFEEEGMLQPRETTWIDSFELGETPPEDPLS